MPQRFNIGQRGEKNSQAKLKNRDVQRIRRLLERGYSIWEVKKMFDVSHTCVWMIKKNRTWRYTQ